MGLAEDMKKIKDAELDIELLERANDKLCAKNNEEIAGLEENIKSIEFIIKDELKASGETKLECKFDGYKGSTVFKKQPDEWTYDDAILMAWIISLPEKIKELFLKVTTTLKKGDLKNRIIDDNPRDFEDNKRINYDPGLQLYLVGDDDDYKVKGIEIKRQDPKFSYTIKKKK